MTTVDIDEQAWSADIEAIEQVVATVEHSQEYRLPGEFVALFRQDAIWTTAHGKRLFGRDEISAFTHQVLPGRAWSATYDVEYVLFIRPDIAAVKVRQRPVTLDGEPIADQQEGSPLYVMAKENGRWLLVAGQNTLVLES